MPNNLDLRATNLASKHAQLLLDLYAL